MDRYVADPHWHGLITWYFFLGGIAAGSYAVAAMARLFGDEDDGRVARVADYLAFPLVAICGVLLIVDLGRPERFWHMMIRSETGWPMFKWWSPMSVGSWGLSVFGALSSLSFAGALVEDGHFGLGRWAERVSRFRRGRAGMLFRLAAAGSAFFLGSYTGALLSATNQPVWANTTWISPLFLASSASTGAAAVLLLARGFLRDVPHEALDRWEAVDAWAMGLELLMLLALALSLGGLAIPAFGGEEGKRWPGILVPAFVVPFGLLLPLALKRLPGRRGALAAAALVLLGGFALRAAIVGIPGPWLLHADRPVSGDRV
jgi:protein NrfD